jgi:hypothetical protein
MRVDEIMIIMRESQWNNDDNESRWNNDDNERKSMK